MFFGSDATGKLWYFKPLLNSNESYSIIAFQDIQEHKRLNISKAVVITTAILLSLQLTVTLYLCVKISLTSLMSTISIALKDNTSEDFELKELDSCRHNKIQAQKITSTSSNNERRHSIQLFAESVLNRMLERERRNRSIETSEIAYYDTESSTTDIRCQTCDSEEMKKANTSENLDDLVPKKTFHNLNPKEGIDLKNVTDDNPDSIFTLSREVVHVNDNGTTDFDTSSKIDLDPPIAEDDIIVLPHVDLDVSKIKRSIKRRKRILFPKVEDYKPVVPISGAKLVNIPLTSAVICVSRKDIICTTSLILQVICLVITYILSFNGFNISGKEVSLERYIWSIRFTELSMLMITMVDPITSMIFSSNYRSAAKSILKCGRSE